MSNEKNGDAGTPTIEECAIPEQTNWYLPYMNKKTNGEEVAERRAPVAVFYCAGASNVGQVTLAGAVEAASKMGYDRAALLCLASISAGLKNIHNGAARARGVIAVDGCPMSCARKTLEKADLPVDRAIVVTKDLGVQKNFDLKDGPVVDIVAAAVAKAVVSIEEAPVAR